MTQPGALNDVYMMYLYTCRSVKEIGVLKGEIGRAHKRQLAEISCILRERCHFLIPPLIMYGRRVAVVI